MLGVALVVIGLCVALFLLTALIGAPYVPSQRREVREVFSELRPLKSGDVVVDIGSGDGVVLKEVCEHGARAVGFEINPVLVALTWWRLRRHAARCKVQLRNFWTTPFPDDTTVVYTFGDSRDIRKMYDKVVREATRLDHSIDFISYGFNVPDIAPTKSHRAHYLYTVAALHRDAA